MEKLGLHPDNCTIASVDAEDFYPSVKFKLVRRESKLCLPTAPKSKRNYKKNKEVYFNGYQTKPTLDAVGIG